MVIVLFLSFLFQPINHASFYKYYEGVWSSQNYWNTQSPLPVYGEAHRSAPCMMEAAVAGQTRIEHIDPAVCPQCMNAALLRAGDFDRTFFIIINDGVRTGYFGPFKSVDASARHDIPGNFSKGWVVDVGYNEAVSMGTMNPTRVIVTEKEPQNLPRIPLAPVREPNCFLTNPPQSGSYVTNHLTVRAGPGKNYKQTGAIGKYEEVNVISIDQGWIQIPGGWISSLYVVRR